MEQFWTGARYFVESTQRALPDPAIQQFLIRLLGITLGLFVLAHAVAFLTLLPFQIIFSIVQLLLMPIGISFPESLLASLSLLPVSWHGVTASAENSLSIALTSYVNRFTLSLPFMFLLIMRYVWWGPLDGLFKRGMTLWDPKMAEDLYSLPPQSQLDSAKECLIRMGWTLSTSLVLLLLSLIPVLGHFVFPAAQFYLTYKSLGLPMAVALFAANLIPFVNQYSRGLYEHIYSCQSMARELMEPYFTRVRPSRGERKALIKRYAPLFYGFFTPFALCLSVSVLGPVAFAFAQATVAIVLVKEMEKNKDLESLRPKSED